MPSPQAASQVHIGGMTAQALLHALRRGNVELNQAAQELFADPRFSPSRSRTTVEVALRSVAALGFANGATYPQLIARALESGLVEGPLELGPHLRLQYLDQPEVVAPATQHRAPTGSITVASRLLDGSDETPKGFYLRRIQGALWLRGYRAPIDHVWSPEDVFAFICGPASPRS